MDVGITSAPMMGVNVNRNPIPVDRSQFLDVLKKMADNGKVTGIGEVKVPGMAVPQMAHGDGSSDPVADYDAALASGNSMAAKWIRIAETRRVFAEALEKELESLREKLRKQ